MGCIAKYEAGGKLFSPTDALRCQLPSLFLSLDSFKKKTKIKKQKYKNRTSAEPNRHPTGILAASRRALIQQSTSILSFFPPFLYHDATFRLDVKFFFLFFCFIVAQA